MGPKTATRAEQKQQTRAALVAAARNLFNTQGYTATGAEMIAKTAGVSRATFYLHFRSKAEVVREIMREIEPEVVGAYERLDAMVDPTHDDVAAWLEEHAQLWRMYRPEFAAMEQALAHEAAVADEWYALHRHTQERMVHINGRRASDMEQMRTRAHFMSLMMSVDRNFYFLILRGHDENYAAVIDVLADQWLALLKP
ncbi:TetR/AcrR family transcriptional regulator [Georgenia sp. AZ-5]|uniref:TetR/AcrR family transcriptional regulator n=1 Tax=Georgenia sp. AZ-5 TaxID=3367526 RepID=UPI0037545D86